MMQEVLLREGMLSQLKTWRGMEMERIITARHETIHNRKNFWRIIFSFSIDCISIIFSLTVYTYLKKQIVTALS